MTVLIVMGYQVDSFYDEAGPFVTIDPSSTGGINRTEKWTCGQNSGPVSGLQRQHCDDLILLFDEPSLSNQHFENKEEPPTMALSKQTKGPKTRKDPNLKLVFKVGFPI
jgi:hypothetical protein